MHKPPADIKIAQSVKLKPIVEIARKLGIKKKFLELYGDYKAKVSLDILRSLKRRRSGKYIFVTAITPTPLGEGKTVTTIGLSMALNKMKKKACACIRQPSLGPVFGIKGGASGGGHAQVLPMEDVNLHLTGDTHAVSIAHNLCAAYLDNSIYKGNPLDIDTNAICWRRVVDVSDRFLRNITIGQGSKTDGIPRKTGFDISVASELMAILALADSSRDLRERIGRIVLAYTKKEKPVTTEDIKVAGAMAVLLKDAVKPNLLQTTENTPVFVHTGPFANIAHGNSSILADTIAIKLSDYVVTEGGFGADIGAEKFFDIKCRTSGLRPDVAVLVCSVRALKMHSGDFEVKSGKPLPRDIIRENVSAVERGASNLEKQVENLQIFGIPIVVCINHFSEDTDKEINALKKRALTAGAGSVVLSRVWAEGGPGGMELARAVIEASKQKSKFRFLYPPDMSIKEKIERIAKSIYGAGAVTYSDTAKEKIKLFTKLKLNKLPVCMAKTHLSLSHDPKRKGRPRGLKFPVMDLQVSAGAGFIYVLCGEIRTMPGLPTVPCGTKIDFDKEGRIAGLF